MRYTEAQARAAKTHLNKAAAEIIEAAGQLGAIGRSSTVDHTDPDFQVNRALDGWCDVVVKFRYQVREGAIVVSASN